MNVQPLGRLPPVLPERDVCRNRVQQVAARAVLLRAKRGENAFSQGGRHARRAGEQQVQREVGQGDDARATGPECDLDAEADVGDARQEFVARSRNVDDYEGAHGHSVGEVVALLRETHHAVSLGERQRSRRPQICRGARVPARALAGDRGREGREVATDREAQTRGRFVVGRTELRVADQGIEQRRSSRSRSETWSSRCSRYAAATMPDA